MILLMQGLVLDVGKVLLGNFFSFASWNFWILLKNDKCLLSWAFGTCQTPHLHFCPPPFFFSVILMDVLECALKKCTLICSKDIYFFSSRSSSCDMLRHQRIVAKVDNIWNSVYILISDPLENVVLWEREWEPI